jgi:hypothetical protein
MSAQPPPSAEWRHLALDPATDVTLYRARRIAPDKSTPAERGTDLLAHTAPSGNVYYYLWHWSRDPKETNICQLTTEESARIFLLERVNDPCGEYYAHFRQPAASDIQ